MPDTTEQQPDAPGALAYVTPDEAAKRLGVAAKTIRAQLASGKLIGLRVGRVWRVQWPPQNS